MSPQSRARQNRQIVHAFPGSARTPMNGIDFSARRQAFRQLHVSGCFVIPNPWDAGSARYLQGLGFKALATTSSGAAWRHAQADGDMSPQAVLEHLREMVAATDLPVNADFED